MVADNDIVGMSEANRIRTDRLAMALRMKEGSDLSRSQSVKHRARLSPAAGGERSAPRSPAATTNGSPTVKTVEDACGAPAVWEYRQRACTMPSKVRPFSPSVYSQASMLSPTPRSPIARNAGLDFGTITTARSDSPVRSLHLLDVQSRNPGPLSNPILDPTPNGQLLHPEAPVEDDTIIVERMRTFTLDPDKAAVVNRGDSFRCRSNTAGATTPVLARVLNGTSSKNSSKSNLSSRSHSPAPPFVAVEPVAMTCSTDALSPAGVPDEQPIRKYHIIVLGADGVGKTSIINQFMTSEYCNPFQYESGECPEENTVNVLLDGEESQLTFIEVNNKKSDMWLSLSGAGYLVVYSVDDSSGFRDAVQALFELRQRLHTSRKPIILVGNKIDLERKRQVTTEEGKHAAKEGECKFVEIAVALGHHVDELLVGVLAQVRMSEGPEFDPQSIPGSNAELLAAFDATFTSVVPLPQSQPYGRSSSGSSSGSTGNGGNDGAVVRIRSNHKKHHNHHHRGHVGVGVVGAEPNHQHQMSLVEKWSSLRKLDDACTHISSVGGRFVQKLFGRRRRSHSLEDLFAFQRR